MINYITQPAPVEITFNTSDIVALDEEDLQKGSGNLVILNYQTTKNSRDVIGVDEEGEDMILINTIPVTQKITIEFSRPDYNSLLNSVKSDLVAKTLTHTVTGVVGSMTNANLYIEANTIISE